MTLQTCNTVFYNYIFKPETPMSVSCQTQKKEMACGFTFKSLTFGINLRLPLKKRSKIGCEKVLRVYWRVIG